MLMAQERTSSQSRKSPSGARNAKTIAFSPKLSLLLSSLPAKTRCSRAPDCSTSSDASTGSSCG